MGCVPCQRQLISIATIPNHKPGLQTSYTKKGIFKEQMTKFKTFIEESGVIEIIREGINYKVFKVKDKDNSFHLIYLIDNKSKEIMNNTIRNSLMMKIDRIRKLQHCNLTQIDNVDFSTKKIQIKLNMSFENNIIESVIKSSDLLAEYEIKKIMKLLFESIHYAKSNNIDDYDLSPERIFIEYKNTLDVKIVNYGLYNILNKIELTKNNVRSMPYYLAPEVLQGNPNPKSDMWSCGILMYFLFYGDYPFGCNNLDIFISSLNSLDDIPFKEGIKSVSNSAKDLIKQLLQVEANKRPMAEEALKHEWLNTKTKPSITSSGCLLIRQEVLEGIMKQHVKHKFISSIICYMRNKIAMREAKRQLEYIFQQCDERISLDDLIFCVERVLSPIETKYLVEKCYSKLDIEDDGLDPVSFLKYAFETESNNIFKLFETYTKIHFNNSNKMSKDELINLFSTGLIYDKYATEDDLFYRLIDIEKENDNIKEYQAEGVISLLNKAIDIICN
jgi:serine/threonine protein kinase